MALANFKEFGMYKKAAERGKVLSGPKHSHNCTLIFSQIFLDFLKNILKCISLHSDINYNKQIKDSIHTVSTPNCYEDLGQLIPCHPK
jgi:hypothetical protein